MNLPTTVAPHLAAYPADRGTAQQRDFLTHQLERMKAEGRMMKWSRSSGGFSSFIIHPSTLHPAPAASPDLLAVIKQEGKV